MAIALTTEPCASTTAAIKPSSMREKYSGDPKEEPILASGGENSAMRRVATEPAKNEPSAATAKAGPARPCRAI